MADVVIKLSGFEEAARLLRALPPEVEREALNTSLRAGARVIAKEAKARAPVRAAPGGFGLFVGKLKLFTPTTTRKREAAIKAGKKVKPREQSGAGRLPGYLRAQIGVKTVPKSDAQATGHVVVTVGKAFYGMFAEFGTRHQPARPWLRQAFDATAPPALQAIAKNLAGGIERAANKLRGRRR